MLRLEIVLHIARRSDVKTIFITKMSANVNAEQVLRAALQEFLTEIQAMAELQAMARNQERQSERLDQLEGRIANMDQTYQTYQTVIMTLVSIMLLFMVAGGLYYNYYGTSRQAKDRYNNKRRLTEIKELLGSLHTDLFTDTDTDTDLLE